MGHWRRASQCAGNTYTHAYYTLVLGYTIMHTHTHKHTHTPSLTPPLSQIPLPFDVNKDINFKVSFELENLGMTEHEYSDPLPPPSSSAHACQSGSCLET